MRGASMWPFRAGSSRQPCGTWQTRHQFVKLPGASSVLVSQGIGATKRPSTQAPRPSNGTPLGITHDEELPTTKTLFVMVQSAGGASVAAARIAAIIAAPLVDRPWRLR